MRYLILLWGGFLSAVGVGIATIVFEQQIAANSYLVVGLLVLVLICTQN